MLDNAAGKACAKLGSADMRLGLDENLRLLKLSFRTKDGLSATAELPYCNVRPCSVLWLPIVCFVPIYIALLHSSPFRPPPLMGYSHCRLLPFFLHREHCPLHCRMESFRCLGLEIIEVGIIFARSHHPSHNSEQTPEYLPAYKEVQRQLVLA